MLDAGSFTFTTDSEALKDIGTRNPITSASVWLLVGFQGLSHTGTSSFYVELRGIICTLLVKHLEQPTATAADPGH